MVHPAYIVLGARPGVEFPRRMLGTIIHWSFLLFHKEVRRGDHGAGL